MKDRQSRVGEPVPPESVFAYFMQNFSRWPDEDSLRDLPLDSNCGQTCKQAIDAAKAFWDASDAMAHGSILDALNTTLEVYWIG